jgi:DNA-binding CsgD family transcriptional regulator
MTKNKLIPKHLVHLVADDFTIPSDATYQPPNELTEIVDDLYQAVLGNYSKWEIGLCKLRHFFKGNAGQFAVYDFMQRRYITNIIEGIAAGITIIENYEKNSLLSPEVELQIILSGISFSSDIHLHKNFEKSRVENKIVPPEHARFININFSNSHYNVIFCITRSINGENFSIEDCYNLSTIKNDLRNIGNIYFTQYDMRLKTKDCDELIDTLDIACAIANGEGAIIHKNTKAMNFINILEKYDLFNNPIWLEQTTKAVRNGASDFIYENINIKIKAINSDKSKPNMFWFDYVLAKILIVFEEAENPNISLYDKLMAKYSLSKTETELIELLKNGKGINEISEIRNRSLETTRSQIKSIREKTNTKSIVKLLNLINNF